MNIIFSKNGWEDNLYWFEIDKNVIKRINKLINDIQRHPFEGIGKPEALKFNLSGFWSRRIDNEHRLVYRNEGENLYIVACKYHYEK